MCNVIYKIIAKVLANRLKMGLPDIISSYQSAFVLARLITDNIPVAFEKLHTMNERMKGRDGYMALKLYMSKAYDKVKLCFLEEIMLKLGFDPKWIQKAMTRVRTVLFSVLINGQAHSRVIPLRGL